MKTECDYLNGWIKKRPHTGGRKKKKKKKKNEHKIPPTPPPKLYIQES